MTFSSLIERCDDWLNPIVVKELRQAVKSRMVVGILLLFVGLQLFLLGCILLVREMRGEASVMDWRAGADVFQVQQGILLWTIMIMVPAYAAIRLAAERSDHNVDLMYISTLRPASIIWGKFFSAALLGLLIFSACAPFMTFTYLLRGIDIPTILSVLGIDLLALIYGLTTALFLSSLPGGRGVKFFFCFLGFVMLAWQCALLTGMTVMIASEGGFFEEMVENWPIVCVIVGGVLAFAGLMFFYCVAMISPPSSNRILPLRIYLFTVWLALGAALFLVNVYQPGSPDPWPIAAFLVTICPFLGVQFWISICEREHWGPRVTRTIPRSPLLRLVSFLFYTGSAGGIAFCILLWVVTFAGTTLWYSMFAFSGRPGEMTFGMITVQILLALYTFCYGMTALLVRHYLLAGQLKANFTWLVGLLLVGLGSSIPAVIAYVVFPEQFRSNQAGWWILPNPIMSIYESISTYRGSRIDEFETMCYWFVATWAALVTVLALPWFSAQLGRFRPHKKRREDPIDAILVEPVSAGAG